MSPGKESQSMDNERKALAEYRLEQAEICMNSARVLTEAG